MGNLLSNFRLARGIANALGLMEQKAFPEKLHTNELQPVISVGPFAPGRDRQLYGDGGNPSIAGGVTYGWTLWGPAIAGMAGNMNYAQSLDGDLTDWMGREFRIRSIRLLPVFDNAGRSAFDTQPLAARVIVWNTNAVARGFGWVIYDEFAQVKSSRADMPWSYPQGIRIQNYFTDLDATPYNDMPIVRGPGWDGYVPPDHQVSVEIMAPYGTVNFPANTTCDCKIWVSVGDKDVIIGNGR